MTHASDDPRPSASARKPTLEELLRLKRAERPDAAFWQDFERGLRQKQLAAIIEPRPWWLLPALLLRRSASLGLPVSAGAAALLAVMMVRTQAPFGTAAGPVEFGPPAAAELAASSSPAPLEVPAPAAVAALPSRDDVPFSPADTDLAAEPSLVALASPAPEAPGVPAPEVASTAALALPLEIRPPQPAAAPTASQLAIARNLEVVKAEEPELLANTLPELASASASATEAAPSADETTLRMVVFNPRHARALVALAEAPAADGNHGAGGIAHVRDRLVHSLDRNDALYGSVSRLGVGGDRLSLSF